MKRSLSVAAVSAALLLAAGCGGSSPAATPPTVTVTKTPTAPKTLTVKGALDTTPNHEAGPDGWQGTKCGALEEPDIHAGTQVLIYNAGSRIVGVGQLRSGWLHGDYTCRFAFTVTNVPATSPIYSIEIAHRGKVPFKRAQLSDAVLDLE